MIDVLLATYNGARFLPEQLASLGAQTQEDWRLVVRDDGSSDGSLSVVREWAASTGRDLVVIEDADTRVGPTQSFARLLARSDAPYFAFCDQDDVWHPEKLERLLGAMRGMEAGRTGQTPLLVHCDLAIVSQDLRPTGRTFWGQAQVAKADMGSDPDDRAARYSLLLQNVVTGCATLGNAELRDRALPVPPTVYIHDLWVALVAAYFGEVRGVPDALVNYRQHDSNTIGAKAWDVGSVARRFVANPTGTIRRSRDKLVELQEQTRCFLDRFGDALPAEDFSALREFADLPDHGFLRRKSFMVRHAAYPQSWTRGMILLTMM